MFTELSIVGADALATVAQVLSKCYLHLITIVKGNEDEHYCEW